MPTYEYACLQCGEHVEVYQSFSDEPLSVCPNCGGQLRKVFHPAGILFRGSGFYKTDNRSSAKKSSNGNGSPGSDSGSGSDASSAKADTKSDGKGSSDGPSSSSSESSSGTEKPAAKTA